MELKKIILEDFKGIKNAEYDLNSHAAKVSGRNGSGKTTLATAFYWVLINKDYKLKDNPNIRPNDMEESLPKVTLIFDVDGKEITLSKSQTMKKSKPDENGICKISTTNSYEINSVPKTERDFKAYLLEEMGIDTDLIAELSHPDVFTKNIGDKKQRDHVRETLFKMCNTYSDLDIAKLSTDTRKVADLLDKYKMDEIKAMFTASRKKANEQIDSIPMQIVGLEKAKVDFDGSALELEKNQLLADIETINLKIKSASNKAEIDKLESEKFALQFDINEYIRKANENLFTERRKIDSQLMEEKTNLMKLESEMSRVHAQIENKNEEIKLLTAEVESLRNEYATQKAIDFEESIFEFDESNEFCKCCGQRLPIDKIAEIHKNFEEHKKDCKKNFEEEKKARLLQINLKGKEKNERIASLKADLEALDVTEITNKVTEQKRLISSVEKELAGMPEMVDVSNDAEYKALIEKDDSLKVQIEKLKSEKVDTNEFESKSAELKERLKDVETKISLLANNSNIDEKISEMKNLILEYEQSKADSESILYQVDLVNKKKNELCEDEINKNFTMVKFKLFDYQKNGSYVECAIPMSLDGKPMYESTNTALEVLMKLDVANGLQRFYGMNLPIILDNAECLDDRNLKAIKSDSQMILLCVTNDDLKVEVM